MVKLLLVLRLSLLVLRVFFTTTGAPVPFGDPVVLRFFWERPVVLRPRGHPRWCSVLALISLAYPPRLRMAAGSQIAASGLSDMRCAHSAHCLSARSRGQSPLLEHCHLLAPARASCACGFALIAAYDCWGAAPCPGRIGTERRCRGVRVHDYYFRLL